MPRNNRNGRSNPSPPSPSQPSGRSIRPCFSAADALTWWYFSPAGSATTLTCRGHLASSTAMRPWRDGEAGRHPSRSMSSQPSHRWLKPPVCSLHSPQRFRLPLSKTQQGRLAEPTISTTYLGSFSTLLRERFSGITTGGFQPLL